MKNIKMNQDKIINYIGYCISILLYISIFAFPLNRYIQGALCIAASCIFAACTVLSFHKKQMKNDEEYAIEVNDERNKMIKYKAGYLTEAINMILICIITIICMARNEIIPAILLSIILLIQPIILVFTSTLIERKM